MPKHKLTTVMDLVCGLIVGGALVGVRDGVSPRKKLTHQTADSFSTSRRCETASQAGVGNQIGVLTGDRNPISATQVINADNNLIIPWWKTTSAPAYVNLDHPERSQPSAVNSQHSAVSSQQSVIWALDHWLGYTYR